MSSPYDSAIDALQKAIAEKEAAFLAEIQPMKITANELCKLANLPPVYSQEALSIAGEDAHQIKFREDEFFNKPLAGSVVTYFEARESAAMERPASIDEIYDAIASGGYKFEGNTNNPDNSKRALKIALTKNTAQFVKIGEKFALKKWYGMRASRKSSSAPDKSGDNTGAEEESTEVSNEATQSSDSAPPAATAATTPPQ